MDKYFLHRIQVENGNLVKGIEIHDSLDSAILAFHGRMKLAYGANPNVTFVSCQITDGNGSVIRPYDETWKSETAENSFFMHYIRLDGEAFSKDIDACADIGTAIASFHAQMEYGYGNTKHQDVTFVSCMITDRSGAILMDETWNKPEPEPEE